MGPDGKEGAWSDVVLTVRLYLALTHPGLSYQETDLLRWLWTQPPGEESIHRLSQRWAQALGATLPHGLPRY